MGETILFCFVFSCQVLLISGCYVRRVLARERYVLQSFPRSTHPRLYPRPPAYYERRLRVFARLNGALVGAGLAIVLAILAALPFEWDVAILAPSQRQKWDAVIVTPFFLLQVVGSVSIELSSISHHRAMAKAPPPRVRTTELRRRRLVDFVSPGKLALAALTNAAFIGFVLYYRRFEFPWFTAAGNIATVTAMLALFGGVVAYAVRAPKVDPYQAPADRRGTIARLVQQAFAVSVALPLLITASLLAKLLDRDSLEPVFASLFCQGVAAAMLWPFYAYRVDQVDFDVYRPDAGGTTPAEPARSRPS